MAEICDVMPLCILFVVKGTKGDRLLFKYPFLNTEESVKSGRSAYSMKIEEDLFTSKAQSSSSLLTGNHLTGLSDDIMAFLFAVRQEVCGQPLEVKINDVRFVCYPTLLHGVPADGLYQQTTWDDCGAQPRAVVDKSPQLAANTSATVLSESANRHRKAQRSGEDKVLLFNIVFGLQGNARRSVVECYQDLSKRLAIALRHEEKRCLYLSRESKIMMDCIEEMQVPPYESHYKLHLEKSLLAKELKQVFENVKESGIVQIHINQWIKVSFCLPQRIHCYPGIGSIEPDKILEFIGLMRPYHGVLLLKDADELIDEISADGAPDLGRLIKFISPLNSLQVLAADTDLALSLVFRLVGHLVYWGKATIIYPLCETNVYRISPTAAFDSPVLLDDFARTFPSNPCMFSALGEFSSPTSLAEFTNPTNFSTADQQSERIDMIVWFLKHFMLLQFRTYVYLALDKATKSDERTDFPTPVEKNGENLPDGRTVGENLAKGQRFDENSSSIGPFRQNLGIIENFGNLPTTAKNNEEELLMIRKQLIGQLSISTVECDRLIAISANQYAADSNHRVGQIFLDDLRSFAKLGKYFNGRHHLEDIMYRENLRRHELLRILTKFNEILITSTHEDDLSAVFVQP